MSSIAFLAVNALVALQFPETYYDFLTKYASTDGNIDEQPIILRTGVAVVELLLVIVLVPRLWKTWLTKDRKWIGATWGPLFLLLMAAIFWKESQKEDGIFEWMTFWAALLAGILFLVHGFRKGSSLAFILATLWLVFAFEEISWGQRVFGWETPENLEVLNYQEETNLHNVINPILVYAFPVVLLVLWQMFGVYTDTICRFLPKKMGADLQHMAHAAQEYGYVDIPLFLVVAFPLWADYTEQCLALFGCYLALGALRGTNSTESP